MSPAPAWGNVCPGVLRVQSQTHSPRTGAQWSPLAVSSSPRAIGQSKCQGQGESLRVLDPALGFTPPSGLWGPQHCRLVDPELFTHPIPWAGLPPTELQSDLSIKRSKTILQPSETRLWFLCIKDESMNICAINSAFIHTGSP